MDIIKAFKTEIVPVVLPGENLKLAPFDNYVRVLQIEAMHPKIVDMLDVPASALANLAANGSSGYETSLEKMDTELEMEPNQLFQCRIHLIDDILLEISHPGTANVIGSTKSQRTYLSKPNPIHTPKIRLTDTTETEIWDPTDNSEAGVRQAKLKKIHICNETATQVIVRLGDGTGGASAANCKICFEVPASGNISRTEEELPNIKFYDSLVAQLSASSINVVITVELEEDIPLIHAPSQSNEIFIWENQVPHFKAINPLAITVYAARFAYAGFKYYCKKLDQKPDKYTVLPVGRFKATQVEAE